MIPLGVIQADGRQPVTADIIINTTQTNLNLLDLFFSFYGEPISGDVVKFTIEVGTIISGGDTPGNGGAPSLAPLPTMRTGIWPVSVVPELINQSFDIRGRGGDGNGPNPGSPGGTAFLVESPISVDNSSGRFASGGGGGGGSDSWQSPNNSDTYQSGGGGGAGSSPGDGGFVTGATVSQNGDPGTNETGGNSGSFGSDPNQPALANGGNGGDLGASGGNSADVGQPGSEDNVGGPAGFSVDGFNLVTWVDQGTLLGPTNP